MIRAVEACLSLVEMTGFGPYWRERFFTAGHEAHEFAITQRMREEQVVLHRMHAYVHAAVSTRV